MGSSPFKPFGHSFVDGPKSKAEPIAEPSHVLVKFDSPVDSVAPVLSELDPESQKVIDMVKGWVDEFGIDVLREAFQIVREKRREEWWRPCSLKEVSHG